MLQERGSGYTFLYSGKGKDEDTIHGVAIAIKQELVQTIISWEPVNERLIYAKLRRGKQSTMHVISVYAPTFRASREEKDAFYGQLEDLVRKIPSNDRLLLLGDLNARVGSDANTWKGIIGKHGSPGAANENGEDLLQFCGRNGLWIANTMFQHKPAHMYTWKHPRSNQWTIIDYGIVRRKYKSDVLDARVRPTADSWTDHRMVYMRLAIRPSGGTWKPKASPKLDTGALHDGTKLAAYKKAVQQLLPRQKEAKSTVEERWAKLKTCVLAAAEPVCKRNKSNRHDKCDWFLENNKRISATLAKKRRALGVN
eukprot:GHVQ01042695.1.p1 GENE.GHVQ01042695.1~~GHVQ01042695.1.p1  ORF type:complete len:311 (+),score=30.89 GHVQ01042695.1:662-1594(+)